MIRLYKDLNIKYILSKILGTIFIVLLMLFVYSKIHLTIIIVLFILLLLAYLIVVSLLSLKEALDRLRKLSNKLESTTEVKEGLKELEILISRAKKQSVRDLLLNNQVGAYINLGNTKKAMKLCGKEEPIFDNTILGKQNRIIYLNNICEISIREGLIPLAKQNLSTMKDLIEDKAFTEEQQIKLNQIYSDLVIETVLKEDEIKDYPSIELYYLKRFNEEENMASKVFFSKQLVTVYNKLKNKKEANYYKKYYEENKGELNYN